MNLINWITGRRSFTDEEVIAAMDPWTLACAAGCQNGSLGMRMALDYWLRLSVANWFPELQQKLPGLQQDRAIMALREFVAANAHKPYQRVLTEVEAARGAAPSVVIGPGESVTLGVAHNAHSGGTESGTRSRLTQDMVRLSP